MLKVLAAVGALGALAVPPGSHARVAGSPRAAEGRDHGLTVPVPAGFRRAPRSLTPRLLDPVERVSLGTFTMPPGSPRCAYSPTNAIDAAGPDDILISLQERRNGAEDRSPRRPLSFGRLLARVPPVTESSSCQSDPRRTAVWWLPFRERGRAFYLLVAIGRPVTAQDRRRALAVVDGIAVR